jgi:hypothetical protein
MTKKSVKDYYAVLGVPSTASLDEIRLAYRRQARAYHPDLSLDPDAEERFKEVNEAYDVLANSEKRKAYDYFTGGVPQDDQVSRVPPHEPSAPQVTRHVDPVAPSPVGAVPPPQRAGGRTRLNPPTWAILLIVIGGCIIISVIFWATRSFPLFVPGPTGGAQTVDISKLATFTSPPTIPPDLVVLQEDDTPLRTILPTTLQVADQTFPVTAVLPEQGRLPLPAERDDLALWIHGTLVNYVIGLTHSDMNASLLAGLSGSDRITLTLANGTELAFGSPQTRRVDAADTSSLAQDTPGLTLLLLGGESASRLVVNARYLPDTRLPGSEQQSGGLSIEVNRSSVIMDETPFEADSQYFIIEFQITNTTQSAIEPTFFDMVLEDDAGQRYVVNEEATALGDYGRITYVIEAGATARGSAGYVIPTRIPPPLVWIFRADPTTAASARFALDYRPPVAGPPEPDVELLDVFMDTARNVIVVSGTVYNDGESALQVTAEGIRMAAGGERAEIVAAAPQLPWTVAAESYIDFELQFRTPSNDDDFLLTILGFEFELERP